jgi:hypothetical protein
VKLDPKYGDAWAYWYAFELTRKVTIDAQQPTDDPQEPAEEASMVDAVLGGCVAAVPNKGEVWCSIAKLTQVRRLDVGTILKKVAEHILLSSQK